MKPSHDRPDAEALIARARDGERLTEREKRGLRLGEFLKVKRAEREALDLMSPQERMLAYRRGRLSQYQLMSWWGNYPDEIPRIDDVPEWIAVTLADICEHPNYVERCRRLRARGLTGKPR